MSMEYEKRRVLSERAEKEKYMDRIRGCLFGGAAGDALGYPVKFWDENMNGGGLCYGCPLEEGSSYRDPAWGEQIHKDAPVSGYREMRIGGRAK